MTGARRRRLFPSAPRQSNAHGQVAIANLIVFIQLSRQQTYVDVGCIAVRSRSLAQGAGRVKLLRAVISSPLSFHGRERIAGATLWGQERVCESCIPARRLSLAG